MAAAARAEAATREAAAAQEAARVAAEREARWRAEAEREAAEAAARVTPADRRAALAEQARELAARREAERRRLAEEKLGQQFAASCDELRTLASKAASVAAAGQWSAQLAEKAAAAEVARAQEARHQASFEAHMQGLEARYQQVGAGRRGGLVCGSGASRVSGRHLAAPPPRPTRGWMRRLPARPAMHAGCEAQAGAGRAAGGAAGPAAGCARGGGGGGGGGGRPGALPGCGGCCWSKQGLDPSHPLSSFSPPGCRPAAHTRPPITHSPPPCPPRRRHASRRPGTATRRRRARPPRRSASGARPPPPPLWTTTGECGGQGVRGCRRAVRRGAGPVPSRLMPLRTPPAHQATPS